MNTKTLNKIKKYCQEEYGRSEGSQHDYDHAQRVASNAIWITNTLDFESNLDKNLLLAACYLHDVVIAQRDKKNYFVQLYNHIFEKILNKKNIRQIISSFDLTAQEQQILIEAIINHPFSIPYCILNKQKDIYSKILQDADSLDYCSMSRERSFARGKNLLLKFFTKEYLSYVRNHIDRYLNIPDIKNKLCYKTRP